MRMYDEKGQLDEHAFSNTPPRSKREDSETKLVRRNSTFRELLGKGNDSGDDAEGNLSWAERCIAYVFLFESVSSLISFYG